MCRDEAYTSSNIHVRQKKLELVKHKSFLLYIIRFTILMTQPVKKDEKGTRRITIRHIMLL